MFVSYRKMSYAILISFFAIVIFVLLYALVMLSSTGHPGTIFTMSGTIRKFKTIETDTDGNGRKDTITVNIDQNRKEYTIRIRNDNRIEYILSSGLHSNSLGPFVYWWPLKITVADINKDRTPEIIIQVSKSSGGYPLYIFRWDGAVYKNILCGFYEGIFISDVTGDGVPELITEEKMSGIGETYTAYVWSAKSYNKINCIPDSYIRGYDKIQAVVKLLDTPFEEKLPPKDQLDSYFTDDWIKDSKKREYLESFARDIAGIQIQDYICEEPGIMNGSSNPVSIWNIRYLVYKKYGTQVRMENYTARIEIQKDGDSVHDYKIRDIVFTGQ